MSTDKKEIDVEDFIAVGELLEVVDEFMHAVQKVHNAFMDRQVANRGYTDETERLAAGLAYRIMARSFDVAHVLTNPVTIAELYKLADDVEVELSEGSPNPKVSA